MSNADKHTDLCVRLAEMDERVHIHLQKAQVRIKEVRNELRRVSDAIATLDSLRSTICTLRERDDRSQEHG